MANYVLVNMWAKKPKVISKHMTRSSAQKKRTKLYKNKKYEGGIGIMGRRGLVGPQSY